MPTSASSGIRTSPARSAPRRTSSSAGRRAGGRTLGYRFQRDRLDQYELSTAWPIAKNWNGFARYVYSLRDDKALERFAGIEYQSCCWRMKLVGRKFVSSRTGEQDTGVYLQLELTGLASVGSAADAFLTGAIRGYERPDTTR